jgi:signal transduction histidine kinase/ligand-binding sensor domain-containing protein
MLGKRQQAVGVGMSQDPAKDRRSDGTRNGPVQVYSAARSGLAPVRNPVESRNSLSNLFAATRLAFQALAIFVACLLWVVVASTRAMAEETVPESHDYVLRVWDLEDGMPDHHVNSITRTDDGYLWITTFSGLVRFDGVRFQLMGKSELPGLPSPWVTPVFAASDRSLWLGLDQGGIARWDRHGQVKSVLPVQPRPTNASWSTSFAEDATGGVWFGSGHDARVYLSKDGVISCFTTAEGVPSGPRVLVCSSAGAAIWCCTDEGIARFDGKAFAAVEAAGPGRKRITRRASGGIWASNGSKLHVYSDDGSKSLVADLEASLTGTYINIILEDHAGDLWIGSTSSGLFRFRDGSLEKVATSLGQISSLMEDNEGTLWVGTWGGGLNRLTRRRFFVHKPHPETEEMGLVSICSDTEGRIWTVDQGGVPAMRQGGPGGSFEIPADWQPQDHARVVHADASGNVWIGTSGGLIRWNAGVFTRESLHADVRALLADGENSLWIATERNGVLHRGPNGYEKLPEDVGPVDVISLARDTAGRIWLGTRDGRVFFFEKGRFTPVMLPDAELDWNVRFILPEGDHIWLGTLLGGLYCWRDGKATRLPLDPALPLAEIRSLFIQPAEKGGFQGESPDDEFWFGTAQGLFSTSRREIERRLKGDEPEIAAKRHGFNDGLPNLEFAIGGANGVAKTPDGHLWFATNRGALEVRPAPLQLRGRARKVIIESARLDRKSERTDRTGRLVLPPKPGLLRIGYTLPELVSPEQVRFRYRLSDRDDGDWNIVGADRESAFVGLAPGQYHFEVAAAVGSGPWLPGTASMGFTVRPAWWQTLYFKAAVILALVAAVWSIVMLRTRSKFRRLRQQRAVERERTRIARDMHDEVGANLTFIASASRLALLDDPAGTAGHLEEISKTARETVDALDEIVWAVNPRYDSLAGTIEYLGKFALRLTSASGMKCEVDLPDEVPDLPLSADARHHLLLAVKEALHNAVKHSRGTKVHLLVTIERGELKVVVEDDGAGFSPDPVRAGSNGLMNMRERMAALGGGIEFETSVQNGARVELRLPISVRPRSSPE